VDGHVTQHRREVPDVVAGETGELASPAERHRNTAQQRQQLVAPVEGPGETHVAAAPDAIDRLHAFGLSQHVLKAHLHDVVAQYYSHTII